MDATDAISDELFQVPEHWWIRRRCSVCGGPLARTCAFTYAMQRQGWVKIGASSNVAERLAVLNRLGDGCRVRTPPGMDWIEPCILLGVLEGDREHELHQAFRTAHAAGEWFLPDAEVLAWLASGDLTPPILAGLPTTYLRRV